MATFSITRAARILAALTTGIGPAMAASDTPTAPITMAEARATALQARPGRITDAELEREAGGSGTRYSFDIAAAGTIYEVGIDARTGAILENRAEGRHPD